LNHTKYYITIRNIIVSVGGGEFSSI